MDKGLKIENSVPIPKGRGWSNDSVNDTIEKMEVEDSVFFETQDEARKFFNRCSYYSKKYKEPIKFIMRKVPNGYRVWRVK